MVERHEMTLRLDDELHERLRTAVFYLRISKQRALHEALEAWLLRAEAAISTNIRVAGPVSTRPEISIPRQAAVELRSDSGDSPTIRHHAQNSLEASAEGWEDRDAHQEPSD